MKKKIWKIFTVAFFASLTCIAVSCSNKNMQEEKVQPSVEFEMEELSITFGKETILRTAVVGDADELKFSSSVEEVATVSQSGQLTAHSLGSTTISVQYGKATDTCVVNVALQGDLPALTFDNLANEEIAVSLGNSINLSSCVLYNGEEWRDATLSYTFSDNTVGKVENGEFVPLKVGQTQLTVTAEWKNVEAPSLKKTLTINVIDNIALLVNGGELHENADLTLYTVSSYGGVNYKKESDFSVSVLENGEDRSAFASVQNSNSDAVSLENGKLTALKKGESILTISYESKSGESYEFPISVKVIRPVLEYAERLEYSALDGILPLKELFGDNSVVLTDAYQGETALTVQENRLQGLSLNASEVTKTAVTVYTDTVGVRVNLNAYAKLIRTQEDLACFNMSEKTSVLTGYIALANDISITATEVLNAHCSGLTRVLGANGFMGVFDGQGYKIDGLTIDSETSAGNGLFGVIQDATVKNIAFTNVRVNRPDSSNIGYLFSKVTGNSDHPTVFDNVYIQIATQVTGTDFSLFGERSANGVLMSNCIFDIAPLVSTNAYTVGKGVGIFNYDSSSVSYDKEFVNCYVVSPKTDNYVFPVVIYAHSNSANSKVGYAGNDYTDCVDGERYDFENGLPVANEDGSHKVAHAKGLLRFDNYASLSENISLGGFVSTCWIVDGGVPVFNGCEDLYLNFTVNGQQTNSLLMQKEDTALLSVSLGNRLIDYDATVKHEAIASFENGVLTAKNSGITTLTISYSFGGKQITETVQLEIEVPTYQSVVEFSAMDGDIPTDVLGEDKTLVAAYLDGVEIAVENGKLIGLTNTTKFLVTKTLLLQADDGSAIYATFNVYTKILKKAEDLKVFNVANAETIVKGYFVLGNDITITATEELNTHYSGLARIAGANGFMGMLDGQGHKIDGLYVSGGNGLFGIIQGATVKNIAFTNIRLADATTAKVGNIFSSITGNYSYPSTFDNVYVECTTRVSGVAFSLFGERSANGIICKNCIFELPAPTSDGAYTATKGVGIYSYDSSSVSYDKEFENCYLISKKEGNYVFPVVIYAHSNAANSKVGYAANDYSDCVDGERYNFANGLPTSNEDGTHAIYHATGLLRYDDLAALKASVKDFTGFSETCWSFKESVWKNA